MIAMDTVPVLLLFCLPSLTLNVKLSCPVKLGSGVYVTLPVLWSIVLSVHVLGL